MGQQVELEDISLISLVFNLQGFKAPSMEHPPIVEQNWESGPFLRKSLQLHRLHRPHRLGPSSGAWGADFSLFKMILLLETAGNWQTIT